jgi:hypothetical protein
VTGGSREYLEEDGFEEHGVRLAFQAFRHPTYTQGDLPFEARLSTLDLLFHCGAGAGDLVRGAGEMVESGAAAGSGRG